MTEKFKNNIAEDILRIRLSQILVNEEYKAGRFKIPIHLALGHEAIAVAVSNVMEPEDKLILSHRNIAYNLARLGKLRPILDEYFLKATGLAGGKLGSMNLINPERGIIYASSILGNNFPVAVGIALSKKILNDKSLTIVLGGDGSIEEGSFYESLVMFKTLNLPTLIIIENNEWSLATHIDERRCHIDISKVAGSVGIDYVELGDNDVFSYMEELSRLREFSLANSFAVCVEVDVSTLGDWRHPDGRFVNYHAGPAPTVDIKNWPGVLRETSEDPVFVLRKHFGDEFLAETSRSVLGKLNKELS